MSICVVAIWILAKGSHMNMLEVVYFVMTLVTHVETHITSSQSEPVCPDVICLNNGDIDVETCTCTCDDSHTGFFCETELGETAWPPGRYSLLTTVFGCPEPDKFGWHRGYINLTLPEDKPEQRWKVPHPYGDPQNTPDPHILGPYHFHSLQLNFCTRLDHMEDSDDRMENVTSTWPPGSYCLFSVGDTCMNGFTQNSVTITGYVTSWSDTEGVLPNISIYTNPSGLTLLYCCREEGIESDVLSLPSTFPFILLKKNNESCSPVHDMKVTEERFDLVDDLGLFNFSGEDKIILKTEIHQRLGLCYYAKTAKRECFYPDDYGFSYTGTVNVSADGRPCLNWHEMNSEFIPGIQLVADFTENFCRVPNPWSPRPTVPLCYVNTSDGTPEYAECDVPVCELDRTLELVGKHKPVYAVENLPGRPPQNTVDGKLDAPPFVSKRPKQKPWVQIDLEESFEIHGVWVTRQYLWFPNNFRFVSVHVSMVRWDFINYGALQCEERRYPGKASQFIFMCSRPIQGQYITIRNFDDPDPENTWGLFFPFEIREIQVFVKRKSCARRLGILSGEVKDFQLTGSSDTEEQMFETGRLLRPGSGWCAQIPNNQFFQVDLIVPTIVSGLELQGWLDGRDVFNVDEFTIEYAVTENNYRSYLDPRGNIKLFRIDETLPPSVSKRILFIKSFVARHVKLNINSYRGNPCLKMEIIGCPKRASRDLMCGTDSTFFGYDVVTRAAFWMEDGLEVNISATACFQLCDDTEGCVSIYQTTKICAILKSSRYNPHYWHWYVPRVSEKVFTATKLCITGIKRASSCDDTLTTPRTLESPSYPFYYGQLLNCRWKIRFEEGRYVRFKILDIKLAVTDTEVLLRQNEIYDISLGTCIDELAIDSLVITSTTESLYKGAIIVSSTSNVDVTLTSCARYSITDATGFLLDISYSDSPGCWSTNLECVTVCELPAALINSRAHPAGFTPSTSCRWNIRGSLGQYVSLKFKVLDIQDPTKKCEVSYVSVLDESLHGIKSKINNFCSHNFPINTLKSSWQFMELHFVAGERSTGGGFMAEYTLTDYIQDWTDQTPNNNTDCDDWEQFGQFCYQVFGDDRGLTWLAADIQCKDHGANLVSLSSKPETNFIHSMLTLQFANNDSRETDFYIGLRKVGNGGSFVNYVWSDGSPLTYTAWYRNESSGQSQPDGLENERCTQVKLYSIHSTNNWHDVACAYDQIRMYICEKPNRNHVVRNDTLEYVFPILPPFLSDDIIFEYFMCNTSEMILLIYRCDGHKDCLDGSDEICDMDCSRKFLCGSGQCVSAASYCDFQQDCEDGSDENSCIHVECLPWQWGCNSGQCISEEGRCDVKIDCYDGSDETECETCQETSFQCYDQRCIPRSRVCDSYNDCSGRFYEEESQNCTSLSQPSCMDWYLLGRRENGSYFINQNTANPFEVECRFVERGSDTVGNILVQTLVHHPHEATVTWLEDESPIKIDYATSTNQLNLLKSRAYCKQYLSVECSYTTNKFQWTGQAGLLMTNKDSSDNCSCPYVGDCFNPKGCNCTQSSNKDWYGLPHDIFLEDSGILTSEEYLPIIQMEPFLLGTTFRPQLRATLGPFLCEEELTESSSSKTIVCENNKVARENVPCVLDFDTYGETKGCRDLSHLDNCGDFPCPENHARCSDGYCIPFHRICDGIPHCFDGGDEDLCDNNIACYGAIRCRQSNICVPLVNVCDDFVHCPLGDDERFCHHSCPVGCLCLEATMLCDVHSFNNDSNSHSLETMRSLRRLHFYSSIPLNEPNFNTSLLVHMPYLLFLDMDQIGIKELSPFQFKENKNLMHLNLSYNSISVLNANTFHGLNKLESLVLKGNPIQFVHASAFKGLLLLPYLDISNSKIVSLLKGSFTGLDSLVLLNVSHMKLEIIESKTFGDLPTLKTLDMRGNDVINFDEGVFTGLEELEYLFTSAFTLCCLRPKQVLEENCLPPEDEFSSCDDLMRNQVLRAFLWIIGLLALLGNIAVLIYRFVVDREGLGKTYGVFVSNLGIADFLMGVYLIILASADTAFRGKYVWNDHHWRNGVACKIAGVLSTLGSEGSVIFLCFITFDRILVVKFPFGNVKMTRKVSLIISLCVWVSLFVLALVPLNSGEYFKGQFYARSAVCLPLPLTRDRPAGWEYSYGLFIVFNMLAFIWIALGQIAIYREIYISRGKTASRGRRHDITIARNLLLVAVTDFFCWFPIGVMGMMALNGNVISGEVYAWIAVFVLPINSALNPFIYTIGATMSKSRAAGKKSSKRVSVKETSTITGVFGSKSFHFAGTGSVTDKMTLGDLTSKRSIKVKETLAVAIRIARSIEMLHSTDLVHGNLAADKVYVKDSKKGLRKVTLMSRPKACTNEEDLTDDINAYGEIVKLLIKYTKTN